jgi:hypothetical protein
MWRGSTRTAVSGRGLALAIALTTIALALPAANAGAVERVSDGGFDATTCTLTDCTSPFWSEQSADSTIGPLCRTGVDSCGAWGGTPDLVGYNSPLGWVQLGGENKPQNAIMNSSVAQTVDVPAAPARLRFLLLIKDANLSVSSFAVFVDGLHILTLQASGDTAYTPIVIDISPVAGGPRTFKFTAASGQLAAGASDSYNIDDVSVDAPDKPVVPPTPATCQGQPATLAGTDAGEVLVGTTGRDVIAARGGDDTIQSRGGNDLVCGEQGNDLLRGEGGADRLFGGDDNDRLIGGPGKRDFCNGDAGNDKAGRGCEKKKDL